VIVSNKGRRFVEQKNRAQTTRPTSVKIILAHRDGGRYNRDKARSTGGGCAIVTRIMARYNVIVQTDLADAPREYELSAALILANHFRADVIFLRPERKKAPDIAVNGIKWEIKSPTGDGKKTIDNNLRAARKQSRNIVLDLRRAKMHQSKALARVNHYLGAGPHQIKYLKIITKTQAVIDIL
jgi:hypothetical protein